MGAICSVNICVHEGAYGMDWEKGQTRQIRNGFNYSRTTNDSCFLNERMANELCCVIGCKCIANEWCHVTVPSPGGYIILSFLCSLLYRKSFKSSQLSQVQLCSKGAPCDSMFVCELKMDASSIMASLLKSTNLQIMFLFFFSRFL